MDEQKPQMQEEDDDLDDMDDLGMFHKSSLRQKEEVPLQLQAPLFVGAKRYVDSENIAHIGEYQQLQKIGKGSFAEVIKASKNGKFYAIKIYSKLKLRGQRFFAADGSFANGEEMLQNEIDIIRRINHRNLIKCEQILQGGNYFYVVGQLCELGQIMNWDQAKNNYVRNQKVTKFISEKYGAQTIEDITRVIFLQAALAIQYMHNLNITNRDIKVDNILCAKSSVQGADIKIADFTTVRYSKDDISYFTSGTPGFRGPEQQFASSDGYGCKATDVWSFGVSMYTFYAQFFPFMGQSQLEIDHKAQNTVLEYPESTPVWLKQILQKMTNKNWKERIKIDEVIQTLSNEK